MQADIDVFRLLIWALRVIVPVTFVVYVSRPSWLAKICTKFSIWSAGSVKSPGANHLDHRLIKSTEQPRPTFEVHECLDDDAVLGIASAPVAKFQFSREVLLASRGLIKGQSETLTMIRNKPRHEDSGPTVGDVIVSPMSEREYLQSLLQFRARKLMSFEHATWEAWNDEAQKILKGVILYKCKGAALEVYETILAAGVLPDEETFTLLVRASLICDGGSRAKVLLEEMSKAGYVPPIEFSQSVIHRDFTIGDASYCALSKDAPVFIPHTNGISDQNEWKQVPPSQKRHTRVRE